jgi:hypothetical protein
MSRLPQPGSDAGNWGNILNDYLSTSLAIDGSLKTDTVGATQLKPNSVTSTALAPNAVTKEGVGLSNVDNTSDADKPISTAMQAALDAKQASGSYATTAALASGLAAKVDTTALASALSSKADVTALNNGLSTKADTTALTSGLSTKADTSALTAGLSGKADTSALTAGLNTKVNTTLIGASNGVASLGSDSKIPDAQLPTRLSTSELNNTISATGDTRYSRLRDHEISAREFGVLGDGSDETTKMQAFLDYITANGAHGVIQCREVNISQPLTISNGRGWTLRGMGRWRGTNIIQTANNVPIIRAGVGGGTSFRDWVIADICLTYSSAQPATSTDANCIFFEAMPYQFELHNVYFRNGYYGIGYQSGVGGAWGGDWDGIIFGSMSGGWINMTGTINSVPNNRFGRLYGDSSTSTDFLFKSFTGYNTTMASIEVINHANGSGVEGRGIFDFTTGSSFIIGAFKLEGGRFTAANMDLVRVPAGCYIQFGEFRLQASNGGLTVTPSSGDCTVFALNSGGTAVSTVEIGLLAVTASSTGFTNGYVFKGGQRFSQVFIRRMDKTQWKLTNRPGGALVNENIRIDQWMNRRLSTNKGDATVAVVPGDTEHTLFFETALTAQRDVTLPSDSMELIGGLQYRIYVAANVVNGTNYLRITIPGVKVVYSKQTTTAESITVEWRTNSSGAAGWIVTGITALP